MKRHPLDPWSLFAGAAFVVIGLVALGGGIGVDLLRGEWVAPVLLLGLAGLLLASVAGRAREAGTPADDDIVEAGDEPTSDTGAAHG